MADRRIHIDILGMKGSTYIKTKLTKYYKCKLTDLRTPVPSGCCLCCTFQLGVVNNRMSNGKSWKSFSLIITHRWCLVPNTRCHFARKKAKQSKYCKNIFWKPNDSYRSRIWRVQCIMFVNVYSPVIAKCLQEIPSKIDTSAVIDFWKYEAKNLWTITFALGDQLWPIDQNRIFVTSQISTRFRRSRQQVSSVIHDSSIV